MHDEQYEAVRKQVVRRLVRQLTFFIHLLFFLLVMLSLALRGAMMKGTWLFALLWGAGLLFHASLAFNLFDTLIERATRRELERRGLKEKPKRRLELGEDGELVEMIEDEDFAPPAGDLQRR